MVLKNNTEFELFIYFLLNCIHEESGGRLMPCLIGTVQFCLFKKLWV